jgi:DNA-3-methyladenine glycosylase II
MMNPLPKVKHYSVKSELNKAIKLDPGLGVLVDRLGYPAARKSGADFATLAKIINSQQLSTHAAAAIWSRLEESCHGSVTPQEILERTIPQLGEAGLSKMKIEYIRGLAERIHCGIFEFESLIALPDHRVISELVKIRGMGVWSAEIFAMFALGRRNFYPARDLALQVAVQRYAGLEARPDEKTVKNYSERWAPHRSSVALLMWKYYGSTTLD